MHQTMKLRFETRLITISVPSPVQGDHTPWGKQIAQSFLQQWWQTDEGVGEWRDVEGQFSGVEVR